MLKILIGLKRIRTFTEDPVSLNLAVPGCVILVTLPGLLPVTVKRFVETSSPEVESSTVSMSIVLDSATPLYPNREPEPA